MNIKKLFPVLLLVTTLLSSGADNESVMAKWAALDKIAESLANSEDLDKEAKQKVAAIHQSLASNATSAETLASSLSSWNPISSLGAGFPTEYRTGLQALNAELVSYHKLKDEIQIKEMESFLKKLGSGLVNAKSPEDLDPFLKELLTFSQRNNYRSNRNQSKAFSTLSSQISNSGNLISEWQNYLIAEESKDSKACKRTLENISRQLSGNPIVPRSYVLRLLNPMSAEREVDAVEEPAEQGGYTPFPIILEKFAQSADLNLASAQLRRLPSAQVVDREVEGFRKAVEALKLIETEAPRSTTRETINKFRQAKRESDATSKLKFVVVVERILRETLTEEFSVLANSESELGKLSLYNGLMKIFDEQIKNEKWSEAANTLALSRDVAEIGISYLRADDADRRSNYTEEVKALQSLDRAIKAHSVGEFEIAVKQYRSAAEGADEPLIFKKAFEGLKALRAEHPNEFKEADQSAKTSSLLNRIETLANTRVPGVYDRSRFNGKEPNDYIKKYLDTRLIFEIMKLKGTFIDDSFEEEQPQKAKTEGPPKSASE